MHLKVTLYIGKVLINGRKVKPEAGKVLVYPCSWTFPHTGAEVKYGSKYMCTTTIGFANPAS